jgi:hypothetical protein
MTESEWQVCTDPHRMLEFLRGRASDRKFRLLAVACHRRIEHLLSEKAVCRKTLEFAERYADGLATNNELHGRAWGKPGDAFSAVLYKAFDAAQNSFLFAAGKARDVVLGADPMKYLEWENAFDLAWKTYHLGEAMQSADKAMAGVWLEKGQRAQSNEQEGQSGLIREFFGNQFFRPLSLDSTWIADRTKSLAENLYADRAFDRLPILADALEKAGCGETELLAHFREPGPHFLGCWAMDLVLGKE